VQNGKPEGGQWSFDNENRKALPKQIQVPAYFGAPSNQYVERAKLYVAHYFSQNPGEVETFCYPVTFDDADEQLVKFFGERFYGFGTYQDAFSDQHPFLFHSVISPSLNCGLLDPGQVVDAALLAYQEDLAPLNAVEGFIRQVIGWREFVRAVYEEKGVEQRTRNYWGFHESMERLEQFEPFQRGVKKLEKFAYAHHIERLMLLGNLCTLFRIHPDEVYRFFMSYFIDAYDWVMVPNVYGMTLHADGGLMTTKPYVSGSNYVKKQGLRLSVTDAAYWDALFWTFVEDHASFFASNPRLKLMLNAWNKFSSDQKNHYRSLLSVKAILE
jgi:deoxyribodipyrimidine photolyase-related protein